MAVNRFVDPLLNCPGESLPTSAYIHVPFCRHRCGYCNFSVVAGREDLVGRFLRAIDKELSSLDRPKLATLFLGGGTPTHLGPGDFQKLVQCFRRRFDMNELSEFTVEANPEDIDEDKLKSLVDAGVNRVSVGVQSFNDAKLKTLQRGHRGKLAQEKIEQTAKFIDNVSIDLIFAAPGETVESWRTDLNIALALPIKHLSTYALTFEKGTTFWNRLQRGDLRSTGEDDELEMYELVRRLSPDSGRPQYEISNFAEPNHRCRHNLAYWNGAGWFAAGPGAARFVNGWRQVNHRSTTTYLRRIEAGRSPTAESERVSLEQAARERVAFGVRLIDGVDLVELGKELNLDLFQLFREKVAKCEAEGLVTCSDGRLRLSELGIRFADTVASRFL